ncbi:thioredoxin TrxC [Bauldia litoralis]|uniref:thioredoxin TrxC n=1 Tax=Bauldia litoralis TaxID=665467 RepID=UPI003264BB84
MTDTARHIVCPHCEAINRAPAGKNPGAAKCGQCHKPLFDGHPAAVRSASFDKHVARNDIPVAVDFWAEWCGPCKMMAPAYAKAAAELEPGMRFLKLDTEAEPQLASRYQIRGIPTTIVFKGGKEIARRAGAMDAATLSAWLKPFTA